MFREIFTKLSAAMLLLAVDMAFETNYPVLRESTFHTDKLRKGKEIVLLQISDLHGRAVGRIPDTIVREAARLQPDAILLTGDLVDRGTRELSGIYDFISKLHSICADIYFVSGNHEWANEGKTMLFARLKSLGVRLLNNEGMNISLAGEEINLCGVDDPFRRRDNIEKAMTGLGDGRYTILMAHSPRIRNRLEGHAPDLILCGHTHGGQVRFPLLGAIYEPGEGFLPYYDKGSFKLDNGSLLYIDSGAGTSKLPIRFLNRSQISRINIVGSRE